LLASVYREASPTNHHKAHFDLFFDNGKKVTISEADGKHLAKALENASARLNQNPTLSEM